MTNETEVPVAYHYRAYVRFVSNQRVLKSRWAKLAACSEPGPSVMYAPSRAKQQEAADTYCAVCPVRQECLELALLSGETDGVWGGVVEQDRREILDLVQEVIDPRTFWDSSCFDIISCIASEYLDRVD